MEELQEYLTKRFPDIIVRVVKEVDKGTLRLCYRVMVGEEMTPVNLNPEGVQDAVALHGTEFLPLLRTLVGDEVQYYLNRRAMNAS